MAVVVLGFPLCQLYENLHFYKLPVTPSVIDITVINNALFLLTCVLLGNNRLRALISASFIFSIMYLAQIPVMGFHVAFFYPVTDMQSFMEALVQMPLMYYSGFFLIVIIITVNSLLAARWLRESKLKPPLKLYISFNLLFVLFTLIVLVWFYDFITGIFISYLSSAFLGTLFLGILLFLFYLYTRLTKENLTDGIQEDEKIGEYKKYIQHLSRRELDVVEAVLAGYYSYKELSNALDISVNTVRTHIRHIYKTTGVSNITALSSLFHGFTPMHPKFTPKSPQDHS
ncbi:MAG: helix-turn-helix transcriptional regulator [Treponema sp.]|jgi:DNA-binding CsgD family transcriptional regulator|nr:helix-turn-helix transcriptional regulator [Treponema sp.]